MPRAPAVPVNRHGKPTNVRDQSSAVRGGYSGQLEQGSQANYANQVPQSLDRAGFEVRTIGEVDASMSSLAASTAVLLDAVSELRSRLVNVLNNHDLGEATRPQEERNTPLARLIYEQQTQVDSARAQVTLMLQQLEL